MDDIISKLKNKTALTWVALVLLLVILLITIFKITNVESVYEIQKNRIHDNQGCGYIYNANWKPKAYPITLFVSDGMGFNDASKLKLFEDGVQIGVAHALHEDIKTLGGGRYSHWNGTLYFSASDCSSPIDNAKEYTVSIPVAYHKAVYFIWVILVILFGASVNALSTNYAWIKNLIYAYKRMLFSIFEPISFRAGSKTSLVMIGLVIAFSSLFLITTWLMQRSISLSVAGYFQVSDSLAYWTCANSLLDLKTFGNSTSFTIEWCQRRAIYPVLLAGIALITERNIYGALLLQSVILSISIFILLRRCLQYIGICGLIICFVLLFRYSTVDLFSLTMTENAGLIFSCVGIAFLIRALESGSTKSLATGIALLSIALNARAGAFFVLPLLILWAGITANKVGQSVLKWIVVSFSGIFAGFLLQGMLVSAVGGSLSNSGGNFSYTLYGLSVGGMGWQQVLTDHPEITGSDAEMSKQIYNFAFTNIVNNPYLFFSGLSSNIYLYIINGSYGFEKLGYFALLVKTIWWLSWMRVLTRIKEPFYLLLALSSAGIILSAPLIIGDGGARVFAATIPVDVIQIGVGVFWLGTLFVEKIHGIIIPERIKSASSKFTFEIYLIIILLLLMIIPFLPIKNSNIEILKKFERCSDEEYTIITNIGKHSTMIMDFVSQDKLIKQFQGEVQELSVRKGLPSNAWYNDQLMKFANKSLIAAYQFDSGDTNAPGPYLLFSSENISDKYYGRMVRICADKSNQQIIFDTPYRKLNSITSLD